MEGDVLLAIKSIVYWCRRRIGSVAEMSLTQSVPREHLGPLDASAMASGVRAGLKRESVYTGFHLAAKRAARRML
ncbi:hypothetical protein D3C84_991120 [compost metagenome]